MGRVFSFAAVLALVLATAASARSTATGGLIVFPATPEGSSVDQLYSITPAGDGLKQLTTGGYPAHAKLASATHSRPTNPLSIC